jgi:hypothetical protein
MQFHQTAFAGIAGRVTSSAFGRGNILRAGRVYMTAGAGSMAGDIVQLLFYMTGCTSLMHIAVGKTVLGLHKKNICQDSAG